MRSRPYIGLATGSLAGSRRFLICFGIACGISAYAETPLVEVSDSALWLNDIEVTAQSALNGLRRNGAGVSQVNAYGLVRGFHLGGEADAIRELMQGNGITSVSDYSGGISIDGSSYSQVGYTLDGAPVFFPYHFGGIFSTFIPTHISKATIDKYASNIAAPDRIGGVVSIESPMTVPEELSAIVNFGMLASSCTVRTPVGLSLSARLSYIGALYYKVISADDVGVGYDLADLNVSYTYPLTDGANIKLNAFCNFDNLNYDDRGFGMRLYAPWHNACVSASYSNSKGAEFGAYYSRFGNNLKFDITQFAFTAPSSINSYGIYGEWPIARGLYLGGRVEYSSLLLQSPSFSGIVSIDNKAKYLQAIMLVKPQARYSALLSERTRLDACLGIFVSNGLYPIARLSLRHQFSYSSAFTLSLSSLAQNLQQSGMSDIGLATNFFVATPKGTKPQRSLGVAASLSTNAARCISLQAEIYAKRILSDVEYAGTIIDVLSDDYSPLDHLKAYNGFNAGANLSLEYHSNLLDASVGGEMCLAKRKYEDGKYHSLPYEPLLSLKSSVLYKPTRHIALSAKFNFSSGRPYTPISSMHIFAGNIIAEYASHNSGRLPNYHRLDLSATWFLPSFKLGRKTIKSFLNFSIVNAYMHKNVEMQYFRYDNDNQSIQIRRIGSLYGLLPSISYTLDF